MVHFLDVNEEQEVFMLPYVEMIRRCEETERKMIFIQKQCERHDISLNKVRSVAQLTELIKAQAEERKTVRNTHKSICFFCFES